MAARSSTSRSRRKERALPERARVAIEGDEAARAGLVAALAGHVEIVPRSRAEIVVHDAGSARDALAAIAPGFSIPTLLLVDDPHAELAHAALAAGAAAVLARQSDARELRVALDAVAAGLVVIDANARDALAPRPLGPAPADADVLTEREHEILTLLAAGLSNRRIAERMAISENTVKAHVAAVLGKLGAATRTEAVTIALRRGLVFL